EGEAEDALVAPEPVVDRAVGDVEVAGLLRGVAVAVGHHGAQSGVRLVVVPGHARSGVVVGVAVGPQHQLAVGVEVDGRGDLLLAVDHPAADEVGDLLHLGGGLGGRAAVGDVGGVAGGAAAAAPLVGPVPVQVGADGAGALVGLGVLPPRLVGAVGDVVLAAVRVDVGQDPDLPGIDQLGHLGVAAVVLGEGAQQVDRHLHGQVLAGVLGVGEQHLGA